jgi:hypothetical protein
MVVASPLRSTATFVSRGTGSGSMKSVSIGRGVRSAVPQILQLPREDDDLCHTRAGDQFDHGSVVQRRQEPAAGERRRARPDYLRVKPADRRPGPTP